MTSLSWLAVLLSFVTSTAALIVFRKLAPSWGLLDHPSERKLHRVNTPLIGGIAVALGMAVSLMWWLPFSPLISSFLVGGAVVTFVGVLDDIYDVSIRMRFFGQALAACVIILSGDTYLLSLGNLLNLGDIHLRLLALPFTLFAIVGVMNAFNMIDGIDGLLGVSSLVALIGYAVLACLAGNVMLAWVATVCIAALVPYLLSNLLPDGHAYKVFMGDAGSLLMGFTITWLFIVGSQHHLSAQWVLEPVTTLFLIALPLMDIITVMVRRIKQKRSPCQADRQHIHHLFEKAGYSGRQTLVWLTLLMLAIATLGIVLQQSGVTEWLRFVVILSLMLGYVGLTKYLKRKMTRLHRKAV